MSLPLYADLGKIAKDLFNKDYNHESAKIEAKTKALNGNDFNLTGEYKNKKLLTTLESKYKNNRKGITLVKKLGSDNSLKLELTAENTILKSLKTVSDANFKDTFSFNTESTYVYDKNLTLKCKYSLSPKQEHNVVIKSAFKQDNYLVNTDIDINKNSPALHSSVVVGHLGWIFGLESSFDAKKLRLTKKNASLVYQGKDFSVLSYSNNFSDYGAYIYKLINANLDLGVSLTWPSNKQVQFGVAANYKLDKNATIKGKLNNSSQINLVYSRKLRDGVKLTISSLLDAKNLNAGNHKIGFGLELNS
jgi:hypothetical protein